MAFKFSLGGAKASKAQTAKAKAEEEKKEHESKLELDRVMAEFQEEHAAEPEEVVVPTGNKRHFTGRQRSMKSGPGTLDSEMPDRLAPPSRSRFGGGAPTGPSGPKQAENVYTTLVAKASNLPPTIDPREVEQLFADFPSLKVTKVEKVPPGGPTSSARPSATMKVVFDKDAVTRDLDDAMLKLNDKKYLGSGYYLHLDRYLGGRATDTAQIKQPFGARWQAPEVAKGYAPPPDLGGSSRDGPREDKEQLIVMANLPPDMDTMRLIHQIIERVILGGMEFEAALMNDPQVQDEERFAWLYDQTHPLNRYYRWRLHQLVCDSANPEIFQNYGVWNGPTQSLSDEFANGLDTFDPADEDSDSSEEEQKQFKPLPMGDNYPGRVDNGYGVLDPRSRAMLLWLLTSLPPGSIVIDDIAAISVFALEHATRGMDEIVDILVSNVITPFQLTDTNPRNRAMESESKDDIRRPDIRQVTLNALRIVHDVLFTTSKESGAAYKYRLAIATQLLERKTFEHLEQLPAQIAMGRMTEKSYRDEVNEILKVWEEESFFDKVTMERLDEVFNGRERQKEQDEHERKLAEKRKRKLASKTSFKKNTAKAESAMEDEDDDMDVDVDDSQKPEVQQHVQGEKEAEATPGAAVLSSAQGSEEMKTAEGTAEQAPIPDEVPGETAAARARRMRPKAEDMFASDEE